MLATSAAASTPPPIAMPTSAWLKPTTWLAFGRSNSRQMQHQSAEHSDLCKRCCVVCAVTDHGYPPARTLQLFDHGSLAGGLDARMHMLGINPHCTCHGSGRTLLVPCKVRVKLRYAAACMHLRATNMYLQHHQTDLRGEPR